MKLNGKNVMLAYTDDIVFLGETENYVLKTTNKLIVNVTQYTLLSMRIKPNI